MTPYICTIIVHKFIHFLPFIEFRVTVGLKLIPTHIEQRQCFYTLVCTEYSLNRLPIYCRITIKGFSILF